MVDFMMQWEYLFDHLHPQEKLSFTALSKRNMFYDKIRDSQAIKEDLAHYRRCPDDHPDKTFDFLWNAMER